MELDHDTCYRALRTRDARFDGRFFTGVISTGVYCRPVCPARTPKQENCLFFACAAAAETSGFRACRRCRPETSPGTPAWQGTSATVARALRLIDDGALDEGGVDRLATRLGVGARHLRRLFDEQLGASPLAVAVTRRVHFGRQLLEQTGVPVGQIALAAGFQNVRRFHAAFRKCFDCAPSEVRGASKARTGNGSVTLRLAFRPPLAWDVLLAYLGPRAIPGVEKVADGVFRRTVELDGVTGILEVACESDRDRIRLTAPVTAVSHLAVITQRVRALCDLGADPVLPADHLARDPQVRRRNCPGLRVPGTWDRWELAARAILGQQVSVAGATTLAGRLVQRFGRPLSGVASASPPRHGADPEWLFPRPEAVAGASLESLAAIGLPGTRAATLQNLARAVCDGQPVLESAPNLQETLDRLRSIAAIGDWTAQYIALRALGEPDAFPAGDLWLRKILAEGPRPLTPRACAARAETWRPWRAYAAMRLWTG